MKTITAKLKIDPQKFEAAQQFMEEKGLDINTELSKSAEDFYKKYVPSAVRKYIEKSTAAPLSHIVNPPPLPLMGRQNPVLENRILTRIREILVLVSPTVPKLRNFGSAMRFFDVLPRGFL